MAVVAAYLGVGADAFGKIPRMTIHQIEGRRKSVGDVTRRTQNAPHHHAVGVLLPLTNLGSRNPIGGLFQNRCSQFARFASRQPYQQPHQHIGSSQHALIFMRESHVGLDNRPQIGMGWTQRRHERRHQSKAANVHVVAAACERFFASGVVRKKMTVIFLNIRIAMLSRSQHERHIPFEPTRRIVATLRSNHCRQLDCQPTVERVLAGLEKLVVVNAALAPIL